MGGKRLGGVAVAKAYEVSSLMPATVSITVRGLYGYSTKLL